LLQKPNNNLFVVLRVAQLPKNYDQHLSIVVRITLYAAVVIHLIFAIFMFGQPDILKEVKIIFSTVFSDLNF